MREERKTEPEDGGSEGQHVGGSLSLTPFSCSILLQEQEKAGGGWSLNLWRELEEKEMILLPVPLEGVIGANVGWMSQEDRTQPLWDGLSYHSENLQWAAVNDEPSACLLFPSSMLESHWTAAAASKLTSQPQLSLTYGLLSPQQLE